MKEGMPGSKKSSIIRAVVSLLLTAAIIAAAILAGSYIRKSAPRAERKPPRRLVPAVSVITAVPQDQRVLLRHAGTVEPEMDVTLKTRVQGKVVRVNPDFEEGGILKKGDLILEVDPTDFKILVMQREQAVIRAAAALEIEKGRQRVAEEEIKAAGIEEEGKNLGLALRKPQLDQAKADLKSAELALESARVQLERTVIRAPFNAVVQEKYVHTGSNLSLFEKVARLVGTDTYRVILSLPYEDIRWIRDFRKREVRLTYGGGYNLEGRIVRIMPELEPGGRMAKVAVLVKDPLGLESGGGRPPLLLGEYVSALIKGPLIEDVFKVPASAVTEGRCIWLVSDGLLEKRCINAVFADNDHVYVKDGIKKGERIVVSRLEAFEPKMAVTVVEEAGSM